MNIMTDKETVSENYKNTSNLSKRMSLYKKYGTNKKPAADWFYERMELFESCRVLELGCGNGVLWENKTLPKDIKLILTDFSQGMVDAVNEKFTGRSGISAMLMDIQNITFSDCMFDVVIANHMLYHVPNIPQAITEVYRVLKPGGFFYASTNGLFGINKFFNIKLKEFNPQINAFDDASFAFTLQNGRELLKQKFNNVIMYEYHTSLEVTESKDLTAFLLSTSTTSGLGKDMLNGIDSFFEGILKNEGIIKIPVQAGIFVSQK